MDIIEESVLKHANRQESTHEKAMPLKDRNFESVLETISKNVRQMLSNSTSKADFDMLVCGGAPGIGKTRFGKELFRYLDHHWVLPDPWTREKVRLKYLFMDFGKVIRLDEKDNEITDPSIIMGLRMAYCYFIEGQYNLSFETFRSLIREHMDLFTISGVLGAISKHVDAEGKHVDAEGKHVDAEGKHVDAEGKQQLFLFLHIDEFQIIDKWGQDTGKAEFFKKMIRRLASFMATSTFIQTFLSGTAPQAVVKAQEPTEVSFQFIECPLLSFRSMLDIAEHYANVEGADKFDCGTYKWMLCRQFLQLLEDTGGLPRALQYLFEQCFRVVSKGTFFRDITTHDFNAIHAGTKHELNRRYNIRDTIDKNKQLARRLLHYSISGIPVQRTDNMDPGNTEVTVESLERDTHIILVPNGSEFVIKMPPFFISIYNDRLRILDRKLGEQLSVQHDMYWQEWEQFVAYYEAFRNNLLIDIGRDTVKLSEVYPGAYGTSTTLGLEVKLQRLSVCHSQERFPCAKLTEKSARETISWEKGEAVIVNGAGASWGDSFVVRCTIDDKKLLILHQDKYDYQSEEYSAEDLSNEHQKNLNTGAEYQKNLDTSAKATNDGFQDLKSYRHITVLFTTRPFSEISQIQDDCLVISESNFKDYFGPVFALHANFALLRQNPNFMEASRMANRIPGVGEATAKKIVLERPYSSLTNLYEKFPQVKRKVEEDEHQHSGKKSKPNLNFFPFEPMDQD
ncbi:hypothetical protein B0O80DRAFT_471691 [Mortierella sp. GBAus27b]|nr:hypothetical protein B0O80DRAFT_471691 [Mortierella sp. GBAus27b]